jgi:outer membrane protein
MRIERNLAHWACWELLAGLAFVAGPPMVHAQTSGAVKIAYIDFQTLIRQDPAYALAESTFNKEIKGLQTEVEKLQAKFDSSMTEYNKQAVVLSPSAKQAKEKQLRDMQQQLQQRATDFQNRVQQRESELIGPIEDRLRGIIEGVRAERNIAIIFDVGRQASNIVAADKSLDITPLVAARLKPAGQ